MLPKRKAYTVKTSKPDPLNTGIPMKPSDFVGQEFFHFIFNVIKHPEYQILSTPDTGQRFYSF